MDRDTEYWESRLKVVEYKSKYEECQSSKDMLQSMLDKLMISKGQTHSSSEETSEVESESTKSEEIGYAGKKRTKSHKYRESEIRKVKQSKLWYLYRPWKGCNYVSLDDSNEIQGSRMNSRDETKAENIIRSIKDTQGKKNPEVDPIGYAFRYANKYR